MMKVKKRNLQWKWIIILIVVLLIGVTAATFKHRTDTINKNQVIEKVKTRQDVVDYFKRVPQARVDIAREENDSYLIQVYEIKNGHTATFNWYKVNKTTGDVEKEF